MKFFFPLFFLLLGTTTSLIALPMNGASLETKQGNLVFARDVRADDAGTREAGDATSAATEADSGQITRAAEGSLFPAEKENREQDSSNLSNVSMEPNKEETERLQQVDGYFDSSNLHCAAAERAIAAGNEAVARLHYEASACYNNAAEVRSRNNQPLAKKWANIGSSFDSAVEAIAEENKDAAILYIQEATYRKNAIEAKIANNEALAEAWSDAALASFDAAQAAIFGDQAGVARYAQEAAYLLRLAEAHLIFIPIDLG